MKKYIVFLTIIFVSMFCVSCKQEFGLDTIWGVTPNLDEICVGDEVYFRLVANPSVWDVSIDGKYVYYIEYHRGNEKEKITKKFNKSTKMGPIVFEETGFYYCTFYTKFEDKNFYDSSYNFLVKVN